MGDAGTRRPPIAKIFQSACFVVTAVAGLAGTVMVIAPGDTDSYFSWPIGPPPLATLVGTFYLASAVTFAALGTRRDWPVARGTCFGILAFTLPTLAATAHHHDLFDWGRWQAGAWVVLFAASPIAFSSFLYLQRGQAGKPGAELPAISRWALAGLGVVYTVVAAGLLLTPARLESRSPFLLPGLSGRFLGSWCAFLAVVALFALWRNRRREAEIPLLVLVLWPVAGLLAALRSFDDLAPTGRRAGYLVVLVALAAVAAVSSSCSGETRSSRGKAFL